MGYVVLAALVAELASIAIVSDLVGWLATMALLAGAVVLGMTVLAGRGVAIMGRAASAMQGGEPVGPVMVDGALVALAGVLLVVPGFVTDVVGLLLLVPPARVLVRRRAERWFQSRMRMVVVGGGAGGVDGDGRDGFIDVDGHEVPGERGERGEHERGSRRLELP
ncbi:MAG: FxsA family protein [Deltaproteobacteria bacterium]|nr:FxsA family protein [Kofleriaceae bacterium]